MTQTKVTPNEVQTYTQAGVPTSISIPTNGWATNISLTLPTTPVAHKYLFNFTTEFANAGGGASNEFAVRVLDGSSAQVMIQYHDCHTGCYFTTSAATYIHSATGGTLTAQAYSQAASRGTSGRGYYTVVDLGVA